MKVVCIGSNIESDIALRGLVEAECKIDALITLPPNESVGVSDYVDMHPFCQQHGIKVIDTVNVNDRQCIAEVQAINADYLFTLGWSQLFSSSLIQCFSQFVIGTHPAPLPFGRGRAPVPWTILEGLRTSAVTFFRIDDGVDSGKIIKQYFFEVPSDIYAIDLYRLVAENLKKGFIEIYKQISRGESLSFSNQDESNATHRAKRSREDGLIDFHDSAVKIDRLIRAVSHPFPGAYTFYNGKRIIFWGCSLQNLPPYSGVVGQILKRQDEKLLVQTGSGLIWLKNPTNEMGEKIPVNAFHVNAKFGYNVQEEIHLIKNLLKKYNIS